MSNYTPEGDKLDFTFSGVYSPDAEKLDFNFNRGGGGQPSEAQYIFPSGIDSLAIGNVNVRLWHTFVKPTGEVYTLYGKPSLRNHWLFVLPNGLNSVQYGKPTVRNFTSNVNITGFVNTLYGRPAVKNLLNILLPRGFVASTWGDNKVYNRNYEVSPTAGDQLKFGKPSVRNATWYVYPNGIFAATFGSTRVSNYYRVLRPTSINESVVSNAAIVVNRNKTIAPIGIASQAFGRPEVDQTIRRVLVGTFDMSKQGFGNPSLKGGVNTIYPVSIISERIGQVVLNAMLVEQTIQPTGIEPLAIPKPAVSPRMIYTKGFVATSYGTPNLRRMTLAVRGFDAFQGFGIPWLSTSPQTPKLVGFDTQLFGTPKVIHRNFKLYPLTDGMVTSVFGVPRIYNHNRYIYPVGFKPDDIFEWNKIFNSKKIVTLKGWESVQWGRPRIIGTPELLIQGISSQEFGHTEVSAGTRTIRAKGADSLKMGKPLVEGTPSITPRPFSSADMGVPTVANRTRFVTPASLRDTSLFGDTTVWLKRRWVKPEGFESERYGDQFVSNFLRWVEPKGTPSSNKFGTHWASHARRYIEPQGIFKEFEHLHKVGGDQFINLNEGIYGTAFGTRIIPERQYLYPLGIVPAFGTPAVNLNTRFITPRGINSGDGEGHEMFGQGNVFNSRQYIRQYFIKESGLVPPELNTTWTHIWNRNKKIGQIGTRFDKFGYHQIYNNARLIEPKGIAAPDITVSLVAYRVREVLPESIDKSFMGSWLVVWNSARPIGVSGIASKLKFGLPEVRNTRRYFPYITAGELTEFGLPMVAYRVRELTFDSRYTIAPPIISLPEVKLQKRYVEPLSFEQARYGRPSLSIHWNKVTPRWTHQEHFGQPFVKNVTPEVLMRGYHAAEYGRPTVFNSNQFLKFDGYGAQLFGRAKVEHRNKTIQVKGSNELRIGVHKVIKGASPPHGLQHISLEKIGADGLPTDGYGIPKGELGKPYMNQNVIYARGIPAPQAFGEALVQNNTITVDYGPFANMVGEPTIIVMRRYLKPESIKSETEVGKPRLSPHTIYAPTGAPPQAVANHPISQTPSPVNAGVKFGNAMVVNRHRGIRGYGVSHMILGTPNVFLRTNYVFVNGIRSFRMGAVNVGDGVQTIKQFASPSFASIGEHTVSRPIDTTQRIRVSGFDSLVFGKHWASKWIREIYPIGLNSQAMGSSRGEQSFYKPQSLHVGFPMPTIPQGFNAEVFGKHWVSLKVRNVEPKGFDMFIMEYDYTAFDKRMRVTRKNIPIAAKQLIVAGIDGCTFGTPDVKLGVQYIRPDGNTDNFRKGVFK